MNGVDTSDLPGGQAYYAHAFNHLGMALIGTDRDLRIRIWNSAATRLFGARPEQMIGQSILSALPDANRGTSERMLRQAIESGEGNEVEIEYRNEQGQPRNLVGAIAPIVNEQGERVGVSAVFRDITNRIRMQTELHEHRKMSSLGEMAGAMSHHFNNILGGIITSVDYARQSEDPAIQSRILDLISDSLTRATKLLKGLLNFAEGDAGLDEPWDYRRILDSVLDEFKADMQSQGVSLDLQFPDSADVPMPRGQVSTVLRNVIQNAVDAMEGGGTLRLIVTVDEHWVITRVEDTGCGMTEADQSRIFEPFWSTKAKLGETRDQARGLGLAVAHGIMHVLGGTIAAASEFGEGSCFIITLPRKRWE